MNSIKEMLTTYICGQTHVIKEYLNNEIPENKLRIIRNKLDDIIFALEKEK